MNQEHLKHLLSQLHTALSDTSQVDDELKSLLQDLDQDIKDVLSKENRDHDDPVFAALSEKSVALSAKFVVQHPKLEPVLRELGSMLEKIGI